MPIRNRSWCETTNLSREIVNPSRIKRPRSCIVTLLTKFKTVSSIRFSRYKIQKKHHYCFKSFSIICSEVTRRKLGIPSPKKELFYLLISVSVNNFLWDSVFGIVSEGRKKKYRKENLENKHLENGNLAKKILRRIRSCNSEHLERQNFEKFDNRTHKLRKTQIAMESIPKSILYKNARSHCS